MSNLPESSNFDAGVYQLELTDPVIGGPSGISNLPLKNLANRTKYLKDHVDALEQEAAGFAPIDSPIFEGNPRALTPLQFDKDASLATTEFVQRALGNRAGDVYLSATGLLAASDAGKSVVLHGGNAFTVTLPSLSSVPSGAEFLFSSFNPANVTLQRNGTDVIYCGAAGTQTSLILKAHQSLRLISINGSWSVATSSDVSLQFSSLFASSNTGGGGYQKLPSGLIMQYGRIGTRDIVAGVTYIQTFPITFLSEIISIQMTALHSGTFTQVYGINTFGSSLSQFGYFAQASQNENAYWLAIGY